MPYDFEKDFVKPCAKVAEEISNMVSKVPAWESKDHSLHHTEREAIFVDVKSMLGKLIVSDDEHGDLDPQELVDFILSNCDSIYNILAPLQKSEK